MQNFWILATLLSVLASIAYGAEEKMGTSRRRLRSRSNLTRPYIPVEDGFNPWISQKKLFFNNQEVNANDLASANSDTEETKEPFAARRPPKRHPKFKQAQNRFRMADIDPIPSIYNERRPILHHRRNSANSGSGEETRVARERNVNLLD
jgi:hypothetical protein